jgi:hypothetical protein
MCESHAYLGREEDRIVDVSLWYGGDAEADQGVSSWQLRMENHAIMKNLGMKDEQTIREFSNSPIPPCEECTR